MGGRKGEIERFGQRQRALEARQRAAEENSLRRIVREAKEQAALLELILAPQVLTKLLRGHRVDLRTLVHDLAWDPLHHPRRYERRFGDPKRMSDTWNSVQRTHDLVLAVERELRTLARRTARTEPAKRALAGAIGEALLRAGIPSSRLHVVEAHAGLDPVPVRGFKRRVLRIVATAERRATGTIRGHVEAWDKLGRLLRDAPLRELGGYFVQERKAAFRASPLGRARLDYLRGERRRREERRRLKRDARRLGQMKFLRLTPR